MFYLGHFSFDEKVEEGKFGHFTCIVEAANPEAGEKAFKKLILDMKKKKTLFTTTPLDIYLDTFVEVGDVPKSGLVTCYSSYTGDIQGELSTYLPHEDKGGCTGYFYYPDDRPDIADKIDAMENHETLPFISFEQTAAQKKAAEQKAEMDRMSRPVIPGKRNPFSKRRW